MPTNRTAIDNRPATVKVRTKDAAWIAKVGGVIEDPNDPGLVSVPGCTVVSQMTIGATGKAIFSCILPTTQSPNDWGVDRTIGAPKRDRNAPVTVGALEKWVTFADES